MEPYDMGQGAPRAVPRRHVQAAALLLAAGQGLNPDGRQPPRAAACPVAAR